VPKHIRHLGRVAIKNCAECAEPPGNGPRNRAAGTAGATRPKQTVGIEKPQLVNLKPARRLSCVELGDIQWDLPMAI